MKLYGRAALAISTVLAATFAFISPAQAAPDSVESTGRLHILQFNVCDQYGEGTTQCTETRAQRKTEIISQINAWGVNAVTLQEICETTYLDLRASLPAWGGTFFTTVSVTNDTRCGTNDNWGIAFIVKGSTPSSIITYYLGTENNEARYMTCGNVTVYSGFRLCSTHLSVSGPQGQVDTVRSKTLTYIVDGAAVMVGGDFNINNKTSCSTGPNKLLPLYINYYGGSTTYSCGPGTGNFREADQYHSGGDTYYDIATNGTKKLDYIFFNYQRFDGSDFGAEPVYSYVSDHYVLRGAMTIFD